LGEGAAAAALNKADYNDMAASWRKAAASPAAIHQYSPSKMAFGENRLARYRLWQRSGINHSAA